MIRVRLTDYVSLLYESTSDGFLVGDEPIDPARSKLGSLFGFDGRSIQ